MRERRVLARIANEPSESQAAVAQMVSEMNNLMNCTDWVLEVLTAVPLNDEETQFVLVARKLRRVRRRGDQVAT